MVPLFNLLLVHMEYTLQAWNASNYHITVTLSKDELAWYKSKALTAFQKDIKEPWFRPWHVPLDIVEKKVQPQYLEVAIMEEAIHAWTKKMLDENKDIKFIGNIYDLDKSEKDNIVSFTYKLDIYPEVEEKNDAWQSLRLEAIDASATEQEIDETLTNLSKQYASYETTDEVSPDSVFKVSFIHTDANEKVVDQGSAYIGKEEFIEFPWLDALFLWKKEWESFTQAYTEENMPPVFFSRHTDKSLTPTQTMFTIGDIKNAFYPEFNETTIKKFFGNENIKTKEELLEKISWLISNQKYETILLQNVDALLQKATESLQITIPKTLVDEEVKVRMKSLQERLWWEDKLKEYFQQLWEEQTQKMHEEIKQAWLSSLQKFFILRKITEFYELTDIDWQAPLNVEKKLYEKIWPDSASS